MKPKRKSMLDNELFTPRTTNDKYPDEKDMKCPKCEFEGDQIDFHCNADEGFCPHCDFVGSNAKLSINRCSVCKGKGSFLCDQSDNSTQVECEDCKGTGLMEKLK